MKRWLNTALALVLMLAIAAGGFFHVNHHTFCFYMISCFTFHRNYMIFLLYQKIHFCCII